MTPTLLTQAMHRIGLVSYLARPATFMCPRTYVQSGAPFEAHKQ